MHEVTNDDGLPEVQPLERNSAHSSDSDSLGDSDDEDSDTVNYQEKIQLLIRHFSSIERLRISKHFRYDAPLFDDDDISSESDGNQDDIYRKITSKNENLTHLYYNTHVIDKNEIQQLAHIFPNVQTLRVDAENLLESKINLKGFTQINRIIFAVNASEEYTGEVDEDETDPDLKFEIQLEPDQLKQVSELVLFIDEFEGQDLKYLLKTFGAAYDFRKIKAYLCRIMINQDYKLLQDQIGRAHV